MSWAVYDSNYLARKRGRLPETHSPNAPVSSDFLDVTGRQRDKVLWYEDGTVILVAQEVEFRVYKGLLADRSPVFKSMFASSPFLDNAVSDCPTFHLTDSPWDLRHMLRVCAPGAQLSPFHHDHPSFDVISATIRLGQKYQMSQLVEHAVDYLKEYYTDDFDEWDDTDCSPPGFSPEHAIGVVNLARLTGTDSLLPTALLACCGLGKPLVDGFERADGTREHLTLDDVGLCFEGRCKIARAGVKAGLRVCAPKVSTKCKSRSACGESLRKLVANLHRASKVLCGPDPFASLSLLYADVAVCSACVAMLEDRDRKERRRLWRHMPSWFGITVEGWDTEKEIVPSDSSGV
ncbi:hypothetical protein V8D89_007017 [Ganoderma adspersum]